VYLTAGWLYCGGPPTRSGRLEYNDAISVTDNQQLLLEIINNRYEERSSLLAVTSVTANVRVADQRPAQESLNYYKDRTQLFRILHSSPRANILISQP
jgi:hypothetical protein